VSFYRLYFRDRDGHFYGVRQFDARNDAQAIERAGRMARGFSRELWLESRFLKRWGDGVSDGMTAQATILSNDRLRPPTIPSQRHSGSIG
jgi:hypothetical protein